MAFCFKSFFLSGLMVALAASTQANAETFQLSSKDIAEGQPLANAQVYKGFGCDGGNLSPELSWSGVPAGTKSFVVTAYDPDAPTGSGWWHWVVFNIPVSVKKLEAGLTEASLPAGAVQGRTDFGQPGFGGACPPPGDKPHRYIFTVFALRVEKLDLDANASPALVGFLTNSNMLGKAVLTATFAR